MNNEQEYVVINPAEFYRAELARQQAEVDKITYKLVFYNYNEVIDPELGVGGSLFGTLQCLRIWDILKDRAGEYIQYYGQGNCAYARNTDNSSIEFLWVNCNAYVDSKENDKASDEFTKGYVEIVKETDKKKRYRKLI